MQYTTRIKVNGKTKSALAKSRSLPNLNLFRKKASGPAKSGGIKGKRPFLSPNAKRKLRNIALISLGLLVIIATLSGIFIFSYLQRLSQELPPISDPFRDKELASVVYDRKGRELYRFIGDYARDPVDIKNIPEHVKWAFLAAEDIDFYTHQGFDPAGIIRCGLLNVLNRSTFCGGSTITQQAAKITLFGGEQQLERKLKELLMSMKIEQAYSKDEILQLYLTVAPFGGQVYGITTASRFYFRKEVQDLTLAEAAILASIVQNPARYSPTKSVIYSPEEAQQVVKERQETYVLSQIEKNLDKINNQTRINYGDLEKEDVITPEMIEEARAQEIHYSDPVLTNIKAGHFVDWIRQQLTSKPYKNGEPFTESDLDNGGYKIYTTLDLDIQNVAEAAVSDAVATNASVYNMSNGAMMTVVPKTGEVITMVGSKSYFAPSEGCDANGANCRFNPNVNVMLAKNSPGSSTKPYATYEAYRQGKMFTGSFLPDIPIELGNGIALKNWNGGYYGVNERTFASQMLSDSRNLPAVIVLESIGIPRFLEVMRSFGYSTYVNDEQYGHSVVLGGADVIGLEHAQAYTAFANQGDLATIQGVSKIIDRTNAEIYNFTPQLTKVADERAAFMVNMSVLNSGGISWDGRDVSMKTGTSNDSMDNWIVAWSPDFVNVVWMGNNNNEPMDFNAFGETTIKPWLKNYLRQIGDTEYFAAASSFNRPAGVIQGGGCDNPDRSQCLGSFVGLSNGYMLEGVDYPVDNIRKKVRICIDQDSHLARPIDEALGKAVDKIAEQYILTVTPQWQGFVDKYMAESNNKNGGPTDYCSVDRSGSGATGIFLGSLNVTQVGANVRFQGQVYSVSGNINNVKFYLDGVELGQVATGTFDQSFAIPAGSQEPGTYNASIVARDDKASPVFTSNPVSVVINGGINSTYMPVDWSVAGPAPVTTTSAIANTDSVRVTYSGSKPPLTNVKFWVSMDGGAFTQMSGTVITSGPTHRLPFAGNYTFASGTHTYRFYATSGATGSTVSFQSATTGNYTVTAP